MYMAKQSRSPFKVTIVFVASLSASLSLYAAAVASVGHTLLTLLSLSTEDLSFILATFFLTLAVIEVLPAKYLVSSAAVRNPQVRKLSLTSAAMLGALFALTAAPCAAGPLLAWTALLLLHPSSVVFSIAAFLLGVALPFVLLGALAQSVGPRLHRSLSRSPLVRRSYEITAALLVLFAIFTLSTLSDPLSKIGRFAGALQEGGRFLLSLAYLLTSVSLLLVLPSSAGAKPILLAALPAATGAVGIAFELLNVAQEALGVAVPYAPEGVVSRVLMLEYALLSLATFIGWGIAGARNGGHVSIWLTASAALGWGLEAFALLQELQLTAWLAVIYYALFLATAGAALSLLSYAIRALKL